MELQWLVKNLKNKSNLLTMVRQYTAFTFVETLITLIVIGVIAVVVIPLLNNVIQNEIYKTAYKKAYSAASQALLSAGQKDMLVSREEATLEDNEKANFAAFKAQFKVVEDCDGDNSSCWASGEFFHASPESSFPSFIDNSGVSWSIYAPGGWDGILVDTNGLKLPNKYGYDRFYFYVYDVNDDDRHGVPSKLAPHNDVIVYDADCCKSGDTHPCYFTSWLAE